MSGFLVLAVWLLLPVVTALVTDACDDSSLRDSESSDLSESGKTSDTLERLSDARKGAPERRSASH